MMHALPLMVIVMGVSGSGKTTVGRALAEALQWRFYDGDDFHPPANVDKMSRGLPLTDADRSPWLAILHRLMLRCLARGESAVVACSALKLQYREQLTAGIDRAVFVYLRGDYDLLRQRMAARQAHFMKADMLRSQFETLEEPDRALVIDVDQDVRSIVAGITQAIHDPVLHFPIDPIRPADPATPRENARARASRLDPPTGAKPSA